MSNTGTVYTADNTTENLEDLADRLHAAGYKVRVNRYGTGCGRHSAWAPDCGVESVVVVGRWAA